MQQDGTGITTGIIHIFYAYSSQTSHTSVDLLELNSVMTQWKACPVRKFLPCMFKFFFSPTISTSMTKMLLTIINFWDSQLLWLLSTARHNTLFAVLPALSPSCTCVTTMFSGVGRWHVSSTWMLWWRRGWARVPTPLRSRSYPTARPSCSTTETPHKVFQLATCSF